MSPVRGPVSSPEGNACSTLASLGHWPEKAEQRRQERLLPSAIGRHSVYPVWALHVLFEDLVETLLLRITRHCARQYIQAGRRLVPPSCVLWVWNECSSTLTPRHSLDAYIANEAKGCQQPQMSSIIAIRNATAPTTATMTAVECPYNAGMGRLKSQVVQRLSKAVKIPTIVGDGMGLVGEDPAWDIFYRWTAFLETTFALV